MGRKLKKKDPDKKRTQRLEKQSETSQGNGAASDAVAKPVAQKKVATLSKQKAVVGEKNFIQKSVQFLREVKIELKKVTWPSRKQTMGSTLVVIILVVIISLFLGVVDFGLSSLIRAVLP